MKQWTIVIALIAQWMPALPLLVGVFRFLSLSREQKLMLLMLGAALLLQFLGNLLEFSAGTNTALYHLHIVVEFTFLALIYQRVMNKIMPKKLFFALMALMYLVSIADAVLINGLWLVPQTARSTEAFLVIGFGILYFIYLLRDQDDRPLLQRFHFWFTVGNLSFFSTNFLVYIYSNFLFQRFPDVARIVYLGHSVIVIMLYVLYTISMACEDRPISSKRADELGY